MKKFLAEITLLNQPFVVNPDLNGRPGGQGRGRGDHGLPPARRGRGDRTAPRRDFAAEVAKVAQA